MNLLQILQQRYWAKRMTDTSTILNIWDTIVRSNTFNFVIFVAILAWVFKKIDVNSTITLLQEKIIKAINDAKKERDDAHSKLLNAEKAVENLGSELGKIVTEAEKSAESINKKILEEAQKQISGLEANAEKIIAAEEKLVVSNLAKSTSKESLVNAETKIKDALAQTPTLHEKYINQSIDELDRLVL